MASEGQEAYEGFWPRITQEVEAMTAADFKHQDLPLARIKRVMKLDEDVRMISAEAPALFARATELFIQELTLRAELEAEGNKRRTLNKADIATAITKYDQFDFLIDIVPKEETRLPAKREEGGMRMVPEQVNFYFQQQVQQQMQQQVQQQQQATRVATQQPQVVKSELRGGVQHMPVLTQPPVEAQQAKQQQEQQQEREAEEPPKQQQGGGIQIIQQLVTPSGEIQQIPVQLTAEQLEVIRAQLVGGSAQPIVIQTAPIQAQLAMGGQGGQVAQGGQGGQLYIQE